MYQSLFRLQVPKRWGPKLTVVSVGVKKSLYPLPSNIHMGELTVMGNSKVWTELGAYMVS